MNCYERNCDLPEDKCTNRKVGGGKESWVKSLTIQRSLISGRGVFTHELIKKNAFVIEYVGEVVTNAEYNRRLREEYAEGTPCYALELGDKEKIDATRKGNCARFINHSCEPNTMCVLW